MKKILLSIFLLSAGISTAYDFHLKKRLHFIKTLAIKLFSQQSPQTTDMINFMKLLDETFKTSDREQLLRLK